MRQTAPHGWGTRVLWWNQRKTEAGPSTYHPELKNAWVPFAQDDTSFSYFGSDGRCSDGWDFCFGGGEELEFGVAAAGQAGVHFAVAVVPEQDLLRGFGDAAGVEVAEQRGVGQAFGAEVEDEIYDRVELALCEWDVDEAGDGLLGDEDVAGQEGFGFGLGDGFGEGLVRGDAVAIADGEDACDILIWVGAEAF